MVNINIEIPVKLHKQLKLAALLQGKTLKEYVIETLAALPEPSLPEPSLPEPSLPEPSLPEPSLPEPSLPEPSQSSTSRRGAQQRQAKKSVRGGSRG